MEEVDDDACVVGGPDWREIKSLSINRKWWCHWITEVDPAGSLHCKFTKVQTCHRTFCLVSNGNPHLEYYVCSSNNKSMFCNIGTEVPVQKYFGIVLWHLSHTVINVFNMYSLMCREDWWNRQRRADRFDLKSFINIMSETSLITLFLIIHALVSLQQFVPSPAEINISVG